LASNTDLLSSPSQALLAPFWDDLHTGRNTATNDLVLYQLQDQTGDGTPDRLVVNWRNVHFFDGSPTSDNGITFQAALQLNTGPDPGQVVFNYTDLNDGSSLVNNNGGSATVGVKDAGSQSSAGRRLLISQNSTTSGLLGNGRAVLLTINRVSPTAVANGPYTVAPGGSVALSALGSSDPDEPAAGLFYLWDLDGDGNYGEAGALAARGDEVGPSPTFLAAGLSAGQSVNVALRVIDRGGLLGNATAQVTVASATAAQVQSVEVNGGAAQRSTVSSLAIRFDRVVTFLGDPAAAFALARTGGGAVGLTVTTGVVDGATVATLTFSGAETEFGSLRDGTYTLTVSAAQVVGGLTAGDYTAALYRLYGDANGDRRVDNADFFLFRGTFGLATGQTGYLAFFDANGDERVDNADFFQFRARFGTFL
jgi:hypothetical protein